MPTPADIRRKNEAYASKVGQRQPAKRSTLERKTKEASTQNAQYTKWLALGLVAVLSGGFFLQLAYLFIGKKA